MLFLALKLYDFSQYKMLKCVTLFKSIGNRKCGLKLLRLIYNTFNLQVTKASPREVTRLPSDTQPLGYQCHFFHIFLIIKCFALFCFVLSNTPYSYSPPLENF